MQYQVICSTVYSSSSLGLVTFSLETKHVGVQRTNVICYMLYVSINHKFTILQAYRHRKRMPLTYGIRREYLQLQQLIQTKRAC